MRKILLGRIALLGLIVCAAQSPARANCTLPYTLTNGQTADATQVMANFNAVIGCMVTPTTGGFINKFRNGTMDVWQRGIAGSSSTTAGATTQTAADSWYVVPTGASVNWSRADGRSLTLYSLKVTGAASVSDVVVKQRIEGSVAAPLSGQTVTVEARVYNNTGGSITPTLTVKHAGSLDNWSSPITDVSAASLQPVANNQWTQVAYTFTASPVSSNGLEVSFDFGNNFGAGSQSVQMTELDIRSTPGVTTGANNGPPSPELRPVASELLFCQRYFQAWNATGIYNLFAVGWAYSATTGEGYLPTVTTMRAQPTISSSAASTFRFVSTIPYAGTAISFGNISPSAFNILLTISGATAGQGGNISDAGGANSFIWASAEL